jgi:hypothetical protein
MYQFYRQKDFFFKENYDIWYEHPIKLEVNLDLYVPKLNLPYNLWYTRSRWLNEVSLKSLFLKNNVYDNNFDLIQT